MTFDFAAQDAVRATVIHHQENKVRGLPAQLEANARPSRAIMVGGSQDPLKSFPWRSFSPRRSPAPSCLR
jgi:hypothetical protein